MPSKKYHPALNVSGQIRAYNSEDEDNFSQAGELFRLLTEDKKVELIQNFANGIMDADLATKQLMVQHAFAADVQYGEMLKAKLAI